MRLASTFPLTIAAALAVGCAAERPEGSDRVTAATGAKAAGAVALGRDLRLQASGATEVEVASPVELSRPTPERRRAPQPRISAKPAPAPAPALEPDAAPDSETASVVPEVAVSETPLGPAPVEEAAMGAGRELSPGKTVTLIPAASGPSVATEEDDSWAPSRPARGIMVGGGGDRCRPRGGVRGIGIAGLIPLSIPSRRPR